MKEEVVAGILTGSLPKDCQEKKLESTTLMVSADNDESLILGEEMVGWIGQIADMRNRVPNDGRWSIWKLTRSSNR
jgi:hypothetical protein